MITIAIPTFNRYRYLARLLGSILPAISELRMLYGIEIFVYDNASFDKTPQVTHHFSSKYKFLRVIRHHSNIGADPNISAIIQAHVDNYLWIIGDDDYVNPFFFSSLMQLIACQSPDVIKLSSSEERDARVYPDSLIPYQNIFLHKNPLHYSPSLGFVQYNDANEILSKFGLALGNFSSMIFSPRILNLRSVPDDDLLATGYSQLFWIYSSLISNPDFIFLNVFTPMLKVRIELVPTGLHSDILMHGFSLLRDHLISAGYDPNIVHDLYRRQHDATLISNLKKVKLFRSNTFAQFLRLMTSSFTISAKLKAVALFSLPRVFFILWWTKRA